MSKKTDKGVETITTIPEEISLEKAVAAKNIKAINDLVPDISSITPSLLRDAVGAQDPQVLDALLRNVTKEEFISKPELMKELIDIKYILSDILKMEARDINQCRITVPGCPEGGYTVFEYAMLNKSGDPEKYLPHIEPAFELIDLGASAAIREGLGIDINKNIASGKKEINGHTPLTYAASTGTVNTVKALIDQAGADPNIQSKNHNLPLTSALYKLDFNIPSTDKKEIIKTEASQMAHTLISRGADVNKKLIFAKDKVKTQEYITLETELQRLEKEVDKYETQQKRMVTNLERGIEFLKKELTSEKEKFNKSSEPEKSKIQEEINKINADLESTKDNLSQIKKSKKFLDLGNEITTTRKAIEDNLKARNALTEAGKDYNIPETRSTIADMLKIRRPREGAKTDPVVVLHGMLSDFQTKTKAIDEQLKIVEESASKIDSSSPFKAVKAHRHLVKEAAKTSEKLLDEMLKQSGVHLEPLSEKVEKIRQEAKRAKELREEIGHAVGFSGRVMNKSNIGPEVAAHARGIGDSISRPTRPRSSPVFHPKGPDKGTLGR